MIENLKSLILILKEMNVFNIDSQNNSIIISTEDLLKQYKIDISINN